MAEIKPFFYFKLLQACEKKKNWNEFHLDREVKISTILFSILVSIGTKS
jgi:hypothetical protein